jgi:hypothetical protein
LSFGASARISTPGAVCLLVGFQETTTPIDIDLGRVRIVVDRAPIKPAEFVIIQIQA